MHFKRCIVFLAMTALVSLRAAAADDAPKYPVTKFELSYGKAHRSLPPLSTLVSVRASLIHSASGYSLHGYGTRADVSLDQTFEGGTLFSDAALRALFGAVVARLNKQGIVGVNVSPDPTQIDTKSGEDLRSAGNSSLHLVVWASQVAQVRTIAKGSRFSKKDPVDNPKQNVIIAKSPLKGPTGNAPASLLDKRVLDDYLRRLDRQPGRKVDAAVSASDVPGDVVLDYLVNENKPWFAFGEVSNTGTAVTNRLSEQVGAVDNELTGHDDIAVLDYITSNFTKANAVFGSYSYPLVFPDYLRLRVYGSWGDFKATTPALDTAQNGQFTGSTEIGGAEFVVSPFAFRGFAFDIVAGANAEHVTVDNKIANTQGSANLESPYVQLRVDRESETFTFVASVGWNANLSSISAAELLNLGRFNTTSKYQIITGELETSAYLETIFRRLSSGDASNTSPANEIAFSVKGQEALGSDRLIPQMEETAGGFFSVRGYPESAVAGDDVIFGTLEYRFHVARRLLPLSSDKKTGKEKMGGPASTLFGRPFNYRPPTPGSRADWDLIIRGFIDNGYTRINQIEETEQNHSLSSVGGGLELKLYGNVDVRIECGIPLRDLKTGVESNGTYYEGINDAKAGSPRLHFLASFIW